MMAPPVQHTVQHLPIDLTEKWYNITCTFNM
jgi:hypothetical protein